MGARAIVPAARVLHSLTTRPRPVAVHTCPPIGPRPASHLGDPMNARLVEFPPHSHGARYCAGEHGWSS
jgi:hypothetical protein